MTMCIYHGGCTDGVAAAWALSRAFEDVEFVAGVYQTDPPNCAGRDVYLVDFSYKRPVLEQLIEQARTVTILDHHKTAEEDLRELLTHPGVHGQFDMDRCGALMTWDYFFPDQPRPALLSEYIDKRDRWAQPWPDDMDDVTMALRSYPHDTEPETLALWSEFMTPAGLDRLRDEGVAINRYYRARVEGYKRLAQLRVVGGVEMPVVNCPWDFASDVAGELAEQSPHGAAAVYWEHPEGVTFSLRSRDDGIDVSEIAKEFGGGGHRGAAGFKVARDAWKGCKANAVK